MLTSMVRRLQSKGYLMPQPTWHSMLYWIVWGLTPGEQDTALNRSSAVHFMIFMKPILSRL
jgi:hypothetical protein